MDVKALPFLGGHLPNNLLRVGILDRLSSGPVSNWMARNNEHLVGFIELRTLGGQRMLSLSEEAKAVDVSTRQRAHVSLIPATQRLPSCTRAK